MAHHGLVGWQFVFNANVRRAGVCYYPHLGRPGRIGLSVHFIERNAPEEVRDTILHEIAHALAGRGKGHGPAWKAKCREIGARPERCYSADKIDMPKGRWRAECPSCKRGFHRHRRPKQMSGWHCKACGPKAGQFTWGLAETGP